MHIQSNDSILIASSHFFGFLSSWYVVALFAGRKARGRAPDEYLKRRRPGLHGFKNRCTSTRVHSVRTHSAFNRGITPLDRSSPCRYCPSVVWFCPLPVPSADSRKLRPRLPSSSTSHTPKTHTVSQPLTARMFHFT